MLDKIIRDVKDFLDPKTHEEYERAGIPYRRGYLLEGTPGTGKSTMVHVLASHFGADVYHVHPSTLEADNFRLLTDYLHNIESGGDTKSKCNFLLMEDIDAAFTKDRTMQDARFPFSVLLGALDSIVSDSGLLIFMTTNYRNRLDDALVRPGRCDVELKFETCVPEQARRLVKHYWPDAPDDVIQKVAQVVTRHPISPAMIQRVTFRRATPLKPSEIEAELVQLANATDAAITHTLFS